MVVIVLDSDSLNHLLRHPARVRLGKEVRYRTSLDVHIAASRVKLAMDGQRALVDEWQRSCDPEAVKVAVTEWESRGGIHPIERLGRLSSAHSKFLRLAGFTDTGDKLVLKIALVAPNRTIVSEDSDFWDPANDENFGNRNAPVRQFLRERLDVNVFILGTFMQIVPGLIPHAPETLIND